MSKKIKYGKFPANALEEIILAKKHGRFNKGDKRMVHPNTAILLRSKGFAEESRESSKAADVIELIKATKELAELTQFESDKRATVVKVLEEQKILLTEIID